MAPSVYCPSAPMFHTLARKPSDRPTPIRISGAAFTNSSGKPVALVSGETRNT